VSNTVTVKQVGLQEVKATPTDQVLKLTFPLTQKVAAKFGWPELPEITKKWSPDIKPITANFIDFTPADPSLASRAFKLECHGHMTNVEVICKAAKGKDARKTGQKEMAVNLAVGFADENLTQLVSYMKSTVKSSIVLDYKLAPEQDKLGTGEDDSQPDLPGATAEQPNEDSEEFTEEDDRAIEKPRGRGRPKGSKNKPKD